MPMVLASFLRLVTSPKIFKLPRVIEISESWSVGPSSRCWNRRLGSSGLCGGPFATPLSSFVRAHPLKGESAKLTL